MNTINKLLIFGIILISNSCQIKTHKLFLVEKNINTEYDFNKLVKSPKFLTIQPDSLRFFLNWEEIASTRLLESNIEVNKPINPNQTTYKNCGKIYSNKEFKVFILLRIEKNSDEQLFNFIIRTYSPKWDVIDSFELATLNEREKIYCVGSINSGLIIERKCDNKTLPDIMQITNNGRIIMTSYHKP